MKRTLQILAFVALLAFAALGVLQWVLNSRLTGYVQRIILPEVETSLGYRVELDHAAANLFSSAVEASGLRVRGVSDTAELLTLSSDLCRLNIAPLSLLRGVVRASELRADHVVVTIASGKDAGSNLAALGKALRPLLPPADAGAPNAATNVAERPVHKTPPRVRIDELRLEALLRFVEHKADGTTAELPLALTLRGEDLGTYAFGKSGRFTAQGHLADTPASCVVDLIGTTGPLGQTLPDFEITGSVKNIDLKRVEAMTRKSGVEGDSATLIVKLTCRKGEYQRGSSLRLSIMNARIRQGHSENAGVINLPPDFSLAIPVTGPVDNPQLDITTGLIQSFLSGFALPGGNADAEKQADDLGRALKQLGKSLKKHK